MSTPSMNWQSAAVPPTIRRPWRVFEEDLEDKLADAASDGDASAPSSVREQFAAVQARGAYAAFLDLSEAQQRTYAEVSLMELSAYVGWKNDQAAKAPQGGAVPTEFEAGWDMLDCDDKAEWVPDDPRAVLEADGGRWAPLLAAGPPLCGGQPADLPRPDAAEAETAPSSSTAHAEQAAAPAEAAATANVTETSASTTAGGAGPTAGADGTAGSAPISTSAVATTPAAAAAMSPAAADDAASSQETDPAVIAAKAAVKDAEKRLAATEAACAAEEAAEQALKAAEARHPSARQKLGTGRSRVVVAKSDDEEHSDVDVGGGDDDSDGEKDKDDTQVTLLHKGRGRPVRTCRLAPGRPEDKAAEDVPRRPARATTSRCRPCRARPAPVRHAIEDGVDDESSIQPLGSIEPAPQRPGGVVAPMQARGALAPENLCPEALEAICWVCGKGDTGDNNDIALCDRCDRAFHQKCHDPPVRSFGRFDDQWFCAPCSAELAKMRGVRMPIDSFVWAHLSVSQPLWPARVKRIDFSSLADPSPYWVSFFDTNADEGAWLSEGLVYPWSEGPAWKQIKNAKVRLAVRLAEAAGAPPISGMPQLEDRAARNPLPSSRAATRVSAEPDDDEDDEATAVPAKR
eukprot:gnl/TRDRNA2_/TRDRNA2_176503_c2_seq12.p1 gnl/TRDRNA2_/TRDRNA2_176503_c2~~gnl/TRDRNA2_/TRDRNA2_176503_c2_seq12.p1  ORF type:complete len:630 (+),score=125.94 gnl/TRDRNA2_/TRDRNA2_176503_c2_seq12:136-2025(+)